MLPSIKVMSFNIRYGLADDGENSWEARKSLVVDRIRAFQPGLLGLQECRDDAQAIYIRDHFPDYQFFGVRRGKRGKSAIEMAPLLYEKSVFAEVEQGHFWLSETPQVRGSKSWGSIFARTATWVKLRHASTNQEIIFLNTHFDYGTELAIEESAKLLKRWAMTAGKAHPLVITGDFNASKDTTAYTILTEGSNLYDVYRKFHPGSENEGTYHGYHQVAEPLPIDWILASEPLKVLNAEIDSYSEGKLYPSDHFPLTADLIIDKALN